jgi:hypothetical protein
VKRSQLLGLFLWRAGLLLVGAYAVIRGVRIAWGHLDLPAQLDWGLSFLAAGALLVAGSVVAERLRDRRAEGALGE